MTSLFMIFTLATTALAKGAIECNFFEPTGARWCFGAVGQPLIFYLSNTANPDITLKKDNKHRILNVKNHYVFVHEEYVNHPESFTNGIFKLGNATKTHSGDYLLEEFGSDGTRLKNISVHLEIIAPVSKPAVSQMCLSPEQVNVSCFSEGDEVEFILTLDGHLLMQTKGRSLSQSSWTINNQNEDKSSVSNVTISLYGQLTGHLMCHVRNNVSRDETIAHLTSCKDFSSFPVVTMAVTASVVTLLLLVLLCLCIKSHRNQPRPTTVDEGNGEDEIIYSDVRVTRKPRA